MESGDLGRKCDSAVYSGVRECLATFTSRAPYSHATPPSTTLDREDVQIGFEPSNESRDAILLKLFDFSKEKIEELNRRMAEAKKNSRRGRSTNRPKKTTKAIKKEAAARERKSYLDKTVRSSRI